MKLNRTVLFLVLVITITSGFLFLHRPNYQVWGGKLAVIRADDAGDRGIYILYPYIDYWKRLTPRGMTPSYMAWSPNSQTLAFFYSTSDPEPESGLALLDANTGRIEKHMITPYVAYFHLLAWTYDGQSIFFDIRSNEHTLEFQELNLKTNQITDHVINDETQVWENINSFAVTGERNILVENKGSVYIVSEDKRQASLLGKGRNIVSMPDGNISFLCGGEDHDSNLCIYDIKNNALAKVRFNDEKNKPISFTTASWSADKLHIVYKKDNGENDPDYIMMYDLKNERTYIIYEESWFRQLFAFRIRIIETAWLSSK